MKLTLETITNSFEAARKLGQKDLGSPMKNYEYMKVMDTMEENERKYRALNKKEFEKFGTVRDDGRISVAPENIEPLQEALGEVDGIEVDISWEPVTLKLEQLTGFTAADMKALDGLFITIETEEGEDNG